MAEETSATVNERLAAQISGLKSLLSIEHGLPISQHGNKALMQLSGAGSPPGRLVAAPMTF